jgi:ubiquinone/menaquinone biosynthesis C-methylase UbiE
MSESLQAQRDAASAYEAVFVPALFAQWTGRVADAARIRTGQRVLDVACGTGVLAREALARTGPTGHVAGVDPVPGMLAVAEQLAPAIEWREGVAESLPFADGAFDAVVSQFGLMFFGDRPRALREMLRVLAPGGRMAIAVWDSLDNLPAYAAEVALLARLAGEPAADALRAPFVLGDRGVLAKLFDQVGIQANLSSEQGTARFASLRAMVEGDLRGWLPVRGVRLSENVIAQVLDEAERALGAYASAEGGVAFPVSAHLVTVAKA